MFILYASSIETNESIFVVFEQILQIWIDQQGMENVLTKDLINIISMYCKDYQVVQLLKYLPE